MCRGIRDFSFEKSEPSLVSVVRGAWVAGLLFCGFEKKRLVRVKLLVVLPVLRCYRRRGREHRAPLQGLTRRWRRVSNCYNTAYGALRVSLVHGPSSAQRIALFFVARSLLAPLSVRPWLALFRDPAALLASLQPAALFASLPPLATTQTPGLPPQGLFRTTRIYPLRHQNSSGQAPPKARKKMARQLSRLDQFHDRHGSDTAEAIKGQRERIAFALKQHESVERYVMHPERNKRNTSNVGTC